MIKLPKVWIGYPSISVYSFLMGIVTFLFLFALVTIIMKNDRLYCKTKPGVIIFICVIASIRLLFPIDSYYGHEFIYRGKLRHIFMAINHSWAKEGTQRILSVKRFLLVIWVVGALIKLIMMYIKHRKAKNYIINDARNVTSEIISSEVLGIEERKYICNHRINMYFSDKVNTPLCYGIWFPRILIPCYPEISEKNIKVIIYHELEHIRNGDLVRKLLFAIMRFICWWFPPFEKLGEYYDLAIEMKTDKRAAKKERLGYVESIIDIMEIMHNKKTEERCISHLHPISLFSDESDMKIRVKKILGINKEKFGVSFLLVILTLFIYILSFFFSISVCPTYEEENEEALAEGYFSPNATNTKIIKKDSGEYEIQMYFSKDDVYSVTMSYPLNYSSDIPIYDERGERIKRPFFEPLKLVIIDY